MMHRITYAVCMSLVLSSLMTAWVTWINLGWSDEFYRQWGHAFMLGWPAAAIISLLSAPEIHRFTTYIVQKTKKGDHHA